MVPGIYFSKVNDKDAGQLYPKDEGQLNDTEQIPEDIQQFERDLHQEAFLISLFLPLPISSTKKNDRDRDFEDPEATPSKKKSKIDEDIVNHDETVGIEENVNKMCNKNDETHIVSPVSKTEGNSQKMPTVVEYSSTTIETPHAVAPSITTSCCLGLIRTEEANKEQGICILNQGQLYFRTLVFEENPDQQVTIRHVNEKGHNTVTSVKVTCPHLFIDLGVGNIISLLEGDLLGIRSIQRLFEYKAVWVDNETVKHNREIFCHKSIRRQW